MAKLKDLGFQDEITIESELITNLATSTSNNLGAIIMKWQ